MRKHLKIAAAIGLLAGVILSSCKKGEDDPAFTLATRRARVAGDWKLKSGSFTINTSDNSGTQGSVNYTFDSGSCDSSCTLNSNTRTMDFSFTASFTKSGDVNFTQQIGHKKLSASGTWDFLGSQGNFSNKERMTIQLTEIDGFLFVNNGYGNRYDFFNKGQATFTYRIKELRSDKMVLVTEQELLGISPTGADLVVTSEYILVQ